MASSQIERDVPPNLLTALEAATVRGYGRPLRDLEVDLHPLIDTSEVVSGRKGNTKTYSRSLFVS